MQDLKKKKRILVYDVAAKKGGAKTILDEWYIKLKADKSNNYLLVTSTLKYDRTGNIENLALSWVKKSWFARIFCDFFYIQKIIKKYNVDEIISLQNLGIPRTKLLQTVYIHNAIPFSDLNFNCFKEPALWVNKYLLGLLIKKSAKKANAIIVQTEWMKAKISTLLTIDSSKILVIPVRTALKHCDVGLKDKKKQIVFFYPATPLSFKNHQLILNSCLALKNQGITNYSVIFTFRENDNSLSKHLLKFVDKNNLPVKFVGLLDSYQMAQFYQHSILIFPSKLETVGLPIIEARNYGSLELLADEPYSREIAKHFDNVTWFRNDSTQELANLMKWTIENH